VATLRQARQIGIDEGLNFVYEGNIPWVRNEDTYCPACGALLIERSGFQPVSNRLKKGACPECGIKINDVGL
jgi:pyruvate formate lyase activating enzyme